MKLTESIAHLNPCGEAAEWLAAQKSPAQAWADCQRGDWMLWLLGKLSGPPESRKKLVLCACVCARLGLRYVPKSEKRPRRAIAAAEAWAIERKSLDDVKSAADAAYAAYDADAAYAAYDAAACAASAAATAAACAASAAYAANPAYAAHDAAAYAAYDAAATAAYADGANADADGLRTKTLARCAAIVRTYYPQPPKINVDTILHGPGLLPLED